MCLSKVYLGEKEEERLFIEEAMQVITDKRGVRVNTLLSEGKYLQDYQISEVDLMENYIILEKKGEANA